MKAKIVEQALRERIDPVKAEFLPRFFRTGPGDYGEGDKFLGVIVPEQRKVARTFRELPSAELRKLLHSPWHECRLTAIFILVHQFEKAGDDKRRKEIYDFYVDNLDYVNNWDIVDSSCHKIMGPWLMERSRQPLYKLAAAKHLWRNRVAMITTYYFIKRGDFGDTLTLAEKLLDHPHDLIHKAVGWMLRETGQQNESVLLGFLNKHAGDMPRTALRYSLEKLDAETKAEYMSDAPVQRSARKHK